MIFDKQVAKITDQILIESLKKQLRLDEESLCHDGKVNFVEDVMEYQKLTNRHWKRKRELEKRVIHNAKYWLDTIVPLCPKKYKTPYGEQIKITKLRNFSYWNGGDKK